MRITIVTLAAVATLACLAQSLPAAEPAPSSEIYIYASYFHCNQALLDLAKPDEAVDKLFGPELNKMIKEGTRGRTVGSWGYLAKNTGGEWSRAGYLTGPTIEDVLGAAAHLDVMTDGKPPHSERVDFDKACASSEDYVWRVLAGNDARGHRGKAAFSTYYVCDQSRETQADALVKRVLAPMYDKMVADHKMVTWAWAEHIVGGKYRRLGTMSAATMEALIKARQEIVAAAEHDPISDAITSICGSHQDYIWDVKDQGPP